MPDAHDAAPTDHRHALLALTERARERAQEDPFGNPVLSIALGITRQMDHGVLTENDIATLIRDLRDEAFDARAARIAAYVGGIEPAANDAALVTAAQHVLRPDPKDSPVPWAQFRAQAERTRYAAVFTAHPTFSLAKPVSAALAQAACGRPAARFASHRPSPITLEEEFAQACAAIANGRDALDRLNAALLSAARASWPDRWTELVPRPVILTSWVGYDTDGRTDIGWWDTLRLRLRMKRLQFLRLKAQLDALAGTEALAARLAAALAAVDDQLATAPDAPAPARRRRLRANPGRPARGRDDDARSAPAAVRRRHRGRRRARQAGLGRRPRGPRLARDVARPHPCPPQRGPAAQRRPPAPAPGRRAGGTPRIAAAC